MVNVNRAVADRIVALLATNYEPWWAQRQFMRSRAKIRVIVAGRQSGKTHAAAREVIQLMLQRPRTESVLLMPTDKSTVGPLKHLRAALQEALGDEGGKWTWREQKKLFRLFNGAELYVRTCESDAKQGMPTRGLTLHGVLWVDEAAGVPKSAWDAARLTQTAVQDPRVIVTGTPMGKNWLYDEFQAGAGGRNPLNASFRFRSTDSPFCNPTFIADMREKLGTRRALQELNAVFLGDGGSVFKQEDVDAFFRGALKIRGVQLTLGVDLAKEKDFTVCTLMNEFGEAWVLWRARHVDWPEQEKKIVALAQDHNALVIVDEGHGGGYGGTMASYLERGLGAGRVLRVKTGNRGVKAQIVETLAADLENARVCMDGSDEDMRGQVRFELLFFEGHRKVIGGTEIWTYHGPKPSKEADDKKDIDHDDCVISLALANWGRVHGWDGTFDPTAGDWSGFSGPDLEGAASSGGEFGDWGPLA